MIRGLQKLAESGDPCLDGRALFLIRNLTRGRGVSFFDDFAYYPDFIVWLRNDDSQHVLFLDPKGLGHYGPREQEKVRLHREIKTVEARVQEQDPALFLHAYVLSNTRAEEIAEGRRSASEWKKAGGVLPRSGKQPGRTDRRRPGLLTPPSGPVGRGRRCRPGDVRPLPQAPPGQIRRSTRPGRAPVHRPSGRTGRPLDEGMSPADQFWMSLDTCADSQPGRESAPGS